jgi:peroxin-5
MGRQAAGGSADTLEQTRALASTLAANKDPKFQNSKFLQFVSKMSRGELLLEDNQVKEAPQARVGGEWASDFLAEGHPGQAWFEQFAKERLDGDGDSMWAKEFAAGGREAPRTRARVCVCVCAWRSPRRLGGGAR